MIFENIVYPSKKLLGHVLRVRLLLVQTFTNSIRIINTVSFFHFVLSFSVCMNEKWGGGENENLIKVSQRSKVEFQSISGILFSETI